MEVGVPEVTIGESVGGSLEPDNDGVHLNRGTDKWMINIIVYDEGGDGQSE